MYLTIILILIFLFVLYLLFVPIVLFIDTDTKQYYLKVKGLVQASIEEDSIEAIRINIKIFFMNFYFYPIRSVGEGKENTELKGKESRSNKRLWRILKILKSFKVKKFQVNIDTGDCITNSRLYPVFVYLNYKVGGFNVNFEGNNQLKLNIVNRPIRIIKSFL